MKRLHIVRNIAVAAAALLLVAASGLWITGCDFNKDDDPPEIPTEEVLTGLSSADTEEEARSAIELLAEKTGLEGEGGASMYASYALPEDELEELAERQAAFNRGEDDGDTMQEVFAVAGKRSTAADLESTLLVFDEVVDDALRFPDDSYAAFILAAAFHGTPSQSNRKVGPGAVLSPIQANLFGAWLSHHGPQMDVFAGNAPVPSSMNLECPTSASCPGQARKAQICHRPGTSAQQTLCVPLPALPAHIRHGDTCGPCHDQGGGE